jgi:hypothetical protein
VAGKKVYKGPNTGKRKAGEAFEVKSFEDIMREKKAKQAAAAAK